MSLKNNRIFILILFTAIFCMLTYSSPAQLSQGLQDIKLRWAPDKRTAIFDVSYKYDNNKWLISLTTTIPEAAKDLEKFLKNTLVENSYELDTNILPAKKFGDSSYAIVQMSVANIRRETRFSAELVDQAILGTELRILKEQSGRYLVQTPYHYLGWMLKGSVTRMNKTDLVNWQQAKKIQVITNYAQIFSKPDINSLPVSDAVFGATLKYVNTNNDWIQVEFPNKETGFIENKYVKEFSPINNNYKIDRASLTKQAKKMLGIPYLWGGNSSKGLDCSGFTQTVFKSQGLILPRDANMQVRLGEDIPITPDFKNVRPGDLLFFGAGYKVSPEYVSEQSTYKISAKLENRITHVAISLGGPLFIHSSGTVHINSFNEEDETFNAYRKDTLRHIKRIIKD